MEFSALTDRAMDLRQRFAATETAAGGQEWTKEQVMAGFVVDVGDLMRLVMAKSGARQVENLDPKLEHELADCLWSVLVLAKLYGIDLEHSFVRTMDEIERKAGGEGSLMSDGGYAIREMVIGDHAALLAMMERTPGICIRQADAFAPTRRYLERNPGLSFVACIGPTLVGCAMAGHDGPRGYLNHVMVDQPFRQRGIATALVERCLAALHRAGIDKAHLEVLGSNEAGKRFWAARGWTLRTENARFSVVLSDNANA